MDKLREDVIECLALLEALIDFGEGEDLEEGIYDQGSSLLNEPLAVFARCLLQLSRRPRLWPAPSNPTSQTLAEVKLFAQESDSLSSALRTQERVACSTSYVGVPPSYNYHTKLILYFQQHKGTRLSSHRSPGPRETFYPFHSISEAFRSLSQIPQGYGRPKM